MSPSPDELRRARSAPPDPDRAAREVRLGIVGFGKFGLFHAGQFHALEGCRVAAVADTSSVALRFLKTRMGALRTYASHAKMLDAEALDAVVIATPTSTHPEIAEDCLARDLAVFVEKPLARSGAEAWPLVLRARRSDAPTMVGYMVRFTETFEHAKALLDTGALGKLQMFRASMYIGQLFKKGKGWRYDKDTSGGGVLITQNAHLVDCLLWFFGPIERVNGMTRALVSDEVEDHAHAMIVFRSGLAGSLDASWSARHHRVLTLSISVQGENGTLEVDDDHVRLFLEKAAGGHAAGFRTWQKPDLFRGVPFDLGGAHYAKQAIEFVDAVRAQDKRRVRSTVETAYRTQLAIDAIYESASMGGAPVTVREPGDG